MTQQDHVSEATATASTPLSAEALSDLTLASSAGVYEIFTEHGIVYEVHLEQDIMANNGRLILSRDPNEPDELEGRHALTIVDMVLRVGEVGTFNLVDLISGVKRLATPLVTGIAKIA